MKNKIRIFCVFLCCIILIISIVYVYSKYKNSMDFKTNTEIAKPIFEVIGTSENQVDVLNNNKYYYEFKVRNFNENDSISEVELKYNIEFVLSQEDAPVIINLYRKNDLKETKIELENNKTIQYEYLDLNKGENLYKAEIMYDSNSKNIMENNLEVKLNIQSVQVEEENI